MSVKAGQAKIRKRTRLGFAKGEWQKIVTAPDVVSEAIELVRRMSCQQWQRFIYLLDQNEWLPAKGFLQSDCIIETGREQIEAVAEQRVISAAQNAFFQPIGRSPAEGKPCLVGARARQRILNDKCGYNREQNCAQI